MRQFIRGQNTESKMVAARRKRASLNGKKVKKKTFYPSRPKVIYIYFMHFIYENVHP